MNFEVQVAEYHRQLNEAALGDFFRALTTKPEKLQQVASPSFRLENPKKNLATVYEKLDIANLVTKAATSTTKPPIDKTKPLNVGDIVNGTGKKLTKGKYKVIQDKGPTVVVQPYSDKTSNVYGKSIEVSRKDAIVESLLIEAAPPNPDKMIDPVSGQIKDEDTLSITLYNAFKASNDGIVTLDQLIRGKTGGRNSAIRYGAETPYNSKNLSEKIIEFINKKGLGNIIKMYDSYEAAQKGSAGMKAGTAIRSGVGSAIKSLGTDAWNMATTKGFNEI